LFTSQWEQREERETRAPSLLTFAIC